jgi:hypothetical protein
MKYQRRKPSFDLIDFVVDRPSDLSAAFPKEPITSTLVRMDRKVKGKQTRKIDAKYSH